MPKQRSTVLSNGTVILGGFDYDHSEACQWFLDGAADGEGYGPNELEPSEAMREAWQAWVAVCQKIWARYAPSPAVGFAPEMPEGFPVDAMHTAEGAGVGIDDGDREYSEGMETELKAMAKVFRYGGQIPTIKAAFNRFEAETLSCIPEREDG